MRDRFIGLFLFLPVPLVLALFTRSPLGDATSLLLGILLVATHRLYARPFALARARRRCLWCGGEVVQGVLIQAPEPGGWSSWWACSGPEAQRLERVLSFARRHRAFLRAGILGTLVLFFASRAARWLALLPSFQGSDATALFRLGVALTVLPYALFSTSGEGDPPEGARLPFDLHIQSLLGTWSTLWLFRVVGVVWLGLGLIHVAERLRGVFH